MIEKRKRRSLLYVPGSSEKMINKAMQTEQADCLIFDLEDSVSPAEKGIARKKVCSALGELTQNPDHRELLVRINSLDTEYALDDLACIMECPPHAIVLPKASPEGVICMDMVLEIHERKNSISAPVKIVPLVEGARGIMEIDKILGASTRITAVQFGAEDFTKDMEISRTKEGSEIAYSRNVLAIACRSYGVDCLDTPYVDFRDQEGCKKDTAYAKSIGMTGRTVIHPFLLELTNAIFSPSEEEMENARRIVSSFEAALKEGRGSVALEGKMVDIPVYERALNVLKRGI